MSIIEQAKEYVLNGWFIFPAFSIGEDGKCTCGADNCADAGKHPSIQKGVKGASRDLKQVEEWFQDERHNICIATGKESGITVFDIDIGEGKFGAESWADAISEIGEPVTLMAKTGSGGMHVFFKYNSAITTSSNYLGKGVDTRNDGGYIIAPPSRHRSGGVYEWINPGVDITDVPSALTKRKETRGRPRNDDMYRGKYSIEQVKGMLDAIPSDDRDVWRNVGIILGREFKRSDEAWIAYIEWSDKWEGKKGRSHDAIMREAFYEISQIKGDKELTIGTIVKLALDHGWAPKKGEVPHNHFVYYAPGNHYIYRPATTFWVAAAVDAAVSPINDNGKIVPASEWLKQNMLATSMTCDPSTADDFTKGVDCVHGELIDVPGAALYNTYRRPNQKLGDAKLATPFLNHVKNIFRKEGDADQFLDYMAHRVQKPWEKPRFALLIAGEQGVGKDTAIEMCSPGIGAWNIANIEPAALDGQFNEYVAATLVRINEAANLHEMSKWAFNERAKVLIAGLPDYQIVNPKYGSKYGVRMFCGVIITTNHLASGIYIPADDRRYDVISSATLEETGFCDDQIRANYFDELWGWFFDGGNAHIAAYLNERDITKFSPNNGQRKTDAHRLVVASGMSSDNWADDALADLGEPNIVRADWITKRAVANGEKEADVKRKLGNALGRIGYVFHRNPNATDGRWKIDGKKLTVYIKGTPPTYGELAEALKDEPF